MVFSRLVVLACAAVCACAPALYAAQPASLLQGQIEHLSAIARPGLFGIAVFDLRDGRHWSVDGARPFPMMSDFKAQVAAAVLARVDAGTLSLGRKVTLERSDYVPGSAAPSIGARLAHGRQVITVAELLQASIVASDNTSADALIRLLGGGAQVTAYLRAHGIADTRIITGEGGIRDIFEDLRGAAKPPAGETVQQQNARLRAGYQAYIAAPPNTTTPDATALFLEKLDKGQMLSRSSTQYLLHLMEQVTYPRRLRAGVPQGFQLADKTGTSGTIDGTTAAYNDTGILIGPNGHTVVITGFISQSTLPAPDRDALLATLTRDVVAALFPNER